jgi:aspartyl-tRNA(Asn)/glutamyl-tRNA(Gln) amidotransferase subunit A
VSPVEVTEAYLSRIERVNPRLNVFLTVLADSALDAARNAEAELARGEWRGPLHGVPVAVKDIVFTRGVRTTMGSRVFARFAPRLDATIVKRLRDAGAIIIAKAHTHEFAFGSTSSNPHYGPCRNPWNREHIPGGSSGGSAASVAAALCPIAIGSDTGGSIREPGALCGVVGLKPTYGRVSRFGVFPVSWTLDHIGPLTRTARDASLVFGAIAGHDPCDRATSRAPVPNCQKTMTDDLRGVRVGLLREHMTTPLDPEVRQLVTAAVQQLAALGAEVAEVSVPSATYARTVSTTIMLVDALAVHESLLRERGPEYGADVRQRLLLGLGLSGLDYVRALRARTRIIADVRGVLERIDVLVGPAVPIPAPRIGQEIENLDGEQRPVTAILSALTTLQNLSGFPTVTVPCGYTLASLPVGLQIAARPLEESMVLRVADAYERSCTTWTRRPPLDDLG